MFDHTDELLAERELEGALIELYLRHGLKWFLEQKAETPLPEFFTDPIFRAAFENISELAVERKPIDLAGLEPTLRAMFEDEGRTGLDKLRELSFQGELPSVDNLVDRLKELAHKRLIRDECTSLAYDVADSSTTSRDDALRLSSLSNEILTRMVAQRVQLAPEIDTTLDKLDALLDAKRVEAEISTGLVTLDRELGGLRRGAEYIIAARPSMGKSAFALSMARQAAIKGQSVSIFSLEMDYDQNVVRLLTDHAYRTDSPIEYRAVGPRLDPRDQDALRAARERLRDLNDRFFLRAERGMSYDNIAGFCRQDLIKLSRRGRKLDIVIVDLLTKVEQDSRWRGDRNKELGLLTNKFCVLAQELDCAIILIHQLSRKPEQRDNQRPLLSDLRDSGEIEQDADVVLFPYRDAYQYERLALDEDDPDKLANIQAKLDKCKHTMELQIAKNRFGRTSNLKFFCDMGANAVRDLTTYAPRRD